MTNFIINAENREYLGTRMSRYLRKSNKIPAIIYGKNKKLLHILLDNNKFMHLIESKLILSSKIIININNIKENVIIKEIQKHPYKTKIIHIDFIRV